MLIAVILSFAVLFIAVVVIAQKCIDVLNNMKL